MPSSHRVKCPTLTRRGCTLTTMLLILVLLLVQAEAADFKAGMEAYERGDFAAALRKFRSLAEQGHAEAQNMLGVMYSDGRGVPEDDSEAVKWLRKAAEQNHPEAQLNIGIHYAGGNGVPKDEVEAVKWYRKAAERGVAVAQHLLGGMYVMGSGVSQDFVQAYAWLNIVAAQGGEEARENKRILAELMSGEERTRAQQLSREYWERYVLPFRN